MLNKARRIVIKIGSSLIIGEDGHHRHEWLATLAEDILKLKNEGKQIIVVTSGAVALGRHVMGYGTRTLTLEEKQAAAAAGQAPLISQWQRAFQFNQRDPGVDWLYPALILLTADDSIDRRRYLNARNTLDTLLAARSVVPVINENDTVATAELRFGDNDRLSARVAQMAGAELLVLLSDVDGLYTANPQTHPQAEFRARIEGGITPDIEAMAGGSANHVGTGGMVTKLAAAKIALAAGCHMIIARGNVDHPLRALAEGARHTLFIAAETPMSARKRWIGGSLHAAGELVVDAGAAEALKNGKSLLPAGVKAVEGAFARGDAVLIRDANGRILGKGLAAYASADARRICGRKSNEIETILGFKGRIALIHRDDMVLE